MPSRKLSQADLDDLHEADDEYDNASNPKSIIRHDGIGNDERPGWTGPKEITAKVDIAAWKGISQSHYYTHKRGGWKLKRGIPYEDKTPDTVPATMFNTMWEQFQAHIASLTLRIAELEAENEQLRRSQR